MIFNVPFVMCDVWCAVSGVRRLMSGVRCMMCNVSFCDEDYNNPLKTI